MAALVSGFLFISPFACAEDGAPERVNPDAAQLQTLRRKPLSTAVARARGGPSHTTRERLLGCKPAFPQYAPRQRGSWAAKNRRRREARNRKTFCCRE